MTSQEDKDRKQKGQEIILEMKSPRHVQRAKVKPQEEDKDDANGME